MSKVLISTFIILQFVFDPLKNGQLFNLYAKVPQMNRFDVDAINL